MASTPAQRTMQARMAAHALHAKVEDPKAHTRRARDKFLRRFEEEVDPNFELPREERMRRAKHARSAYFQSLALKSAKARAAR